MSVVSGFFYIKVGLCFLLLLKHRRKVLRFNYGEGLFCVEKITWAGLTTERLRDPVTDQSWKDRGLKLADNPLED